MQFHYRSYICIANHFLHFKYETRLRHCIGYTAFDWIVIGGTKPTHAWQVFCTMYGNKIYKYINMFPKPTIQILFYSGIL